MVSQIPLRNVLATLALTALALAVSGCGVKGPLRPAPKAVPAAAPATPVPANPKP